MVLHLKPIYVFGWKEEWNKVVPSNMRNEVVWLFPTLIMPHYRLTSLSPPDLGTKKFPQIHLVSPLIPINGGAAPPWRRTVSSR